MGVEGRKRVGAKEIAAFLAEELHVSKREAAEATRKLVEMLRETFIDDGEVTLRGIGHFSVRVRGPRVGRNPRTGDTVPVPARRTVVYRPAKTLKDLPEAKRRGRKP